jgi:hypothetical protein
LSGTVKHCFPSADICMQAQQFTKLIAVNNTNKLSEQLHPKLYFRFFQCQQRFHSIQYNRLCFRYNGFRNKNCLQ